MSAKMILAGVCMSLMSCLATAAAAADPAVAASPVLDDRYPERIVNFAGGVESLPDLVFSTPPGYRPLRLDLYKQKRSPGSPGLPLIVYIHGGGWQGGHTRHSGAFADWPGVLASLAAKGYVVASIEYRLSGEARFPAAIQDVKTSIRWLRSKANEFGIDRTRAIVWGGSAGGQLAALAATSCDDKTLAPTFTVNGQPDPNSLPAKESDCVQGLVAWYGIFDFSDLAQPLASGGNLSTSPVGRYLGCTAIPCAAVAAAGAITHLDARDPPALLIHGETDKVVPVNQSRAFYAALQSKKVPAELLVIPGVDHSFIGATADVTRRASLEALAKTFAFIDQTSRQTSPSARR